LSNRLAKVVISSERGRRLIVAHRESARRESASPRRLAAALDFFGDRRDVEVVRQRAPAHA
jgi:hypothetical protein